MPGLPNNLFISGFPNKSLYELLLSSLLLSSYMPCPCPNIGIQGNDMFFNYPLCGVCIYSAKLASIPSHTREHFCSAINLVSPSRLHVFTVALLKITCTWDTTLCHWVTGYWRCELLPRVTEPSNNDNHSSSSTASHSPTPKPPVTGVWELQISNASCYHNYIPSQDSSPAVCCLGWMERWIAVKVWASLCDRSEHSDSRSSSPPDMEPELTVSGSS